MKYELSSNAKCVLNDSSFIKVRDGWYARLGRLFEGTDESEPVVWLNGFVGYSADQSLMFSDPERWVIDCLEVLAENVEKAADTEKFVPLCLQDFVFGVHFIDSIFGCNVYFEYDQWYNDPLPGEVGTLVPPDIDNSEAWLLTRRMIDAFVDADVKLPIFGLPTVASTLNVAVNLYGEEILVAMLNEPLKAEHDLRVINDVLIELHKRMIPLLPAYQTQPVVPAGRTQPPGFGQICGCTTQLVSPSVYRDLIAPLDEELLGVYPHGGMIHLCGAHEHHIPVFREMKNLRSVQLNDRAAEGLEDYFKGLRQDQIIYLRPFENMTAERAIEITGGKRLVINA